MVDSREGEPLSRVGRGQTATERRVCVVPILVPRGPRPRAGVPGRDFPLRDAGEGVMSWPRLTGGGGGFRRRRLMLVLASAGGHRLLKPTAGPQSTPSGGRAAKRWDAMPILQQLGKTRLELGPNPNWRGLETVPLASNDIPSSATRPLLLTRRAGAARVSCQVPWGLDVTVRPPS